MSYNMFAYCLDNPVNGVDLTGESPYGILNWIDKAIIHLMVQIKVAMENNWAMEVYVKKEDKKGFVDLLDTTNNEFYEIKSEKSATLSMTSNQIEKYKGSIIQDSEGNRRKTPSVDIGAKIKSGTQPINGSFQYGIYDITFSNNENRALITYRWEPNYGRTLALASISVLFILFPEAAPATVPALGFALW